MERLTEAVSDITKQLGPIFRLKLGGANVVVTVNADDAKTLFLNEGKYPIRPAFPALVHYRKKRFNSLGVVPGNGEEWYKYRTGVTPLLKSSLVQLYLKHHEDIADAFVSYAKQKKGADGRLTDVYQHILKYAIEGSYYQN